MLEQNNGWTYDNTIYAGGNVYVSFRVGKDETEIYEYSLDKNKLSKRCFIETDSIK